MTGCLLPDGQWLNGAEGSPSMAPDSEMGAASWFPWPSHCFVATASDHFALLIVARDQAVWPAGAEAFLISLCLDSLRSEPQQNDSDGCHQDENKHCHDHWRAAAKVAP